METGRERQRQRHKEYHRNRDRGLRRKTERNRVTQRDREGDKERDGGIKTKRDMQRQEREWKSPGGAEGYKGREKLRQRKLDRFRKQSAGE